MKIINILLLTIVVSSCNAPEKVRYDSTYMNPVSSGVSGDQSSGGTTNFGSTGTSNSTSGALPTGYENCTTGFVYSSAATGGMSICKHATKELEIRAGFSTTDQQDGTCFVPMYRDQTGNSTYLGSPQCTKHNANQVIYGVMVKNRSGYTQYPMNNLMVMKYSSTTAFMNCMNGYINGFYNCPNISPAQRSCLTQNNCGTNAACAGSCSIPSTTYNSCISYAGTYMTSQCNSFTSLHSYISVNF